MEHALQSFFPLLIFIPLLMSGLAYVKSRNHKKVRFLHLSECFLSLALVTSCSWFLLPLGPAFIILSMLPWIWSLRTLGLVCQDISEHPLFTKFHLYILGVGGIVSIVFLNFNFNLAVVTTPFSLSIGLIGLTFIFQAYSKGTMKSYGYLHHFNLCLILGYFVSRLCYPLLMEHPSSLHLISLIDSYILLTFSASLYPLYAELVFEGHERLLEKVLHARNKQLLSHSGFSEYKILSAGLSHELNNALTIINAKIVRIIRGRTEDLEKDLQMVQKYATKIGDSIRGLREFIYPHDIQEDLEIDDVVNGVLALYGQRLINHGVEVKMNNLSGKIIRGQRIQIEQVFLSLINNSVDALDQIDEKWISISGKLSGNNVEILYKDASQTNAENIVPLLDDPYYAYYEFMDKDIRLVQAKEISEKHGGTFECLHENDESTFLIRLPVSGSHISTDARIQNRIQEVRDLS